MSQLMTMFRAALLTMGGSRTWCLAGRGRDQFESLPGHWLHWDSWDTAGSGRCTKDIIILYLLLFVINQLATYMRIESSNSQLIIS